MLNIVGGLFGDVNIDLIVKEGVDLAQAPLNLLNIEQGAHGGTSAGQGQASSISFLLNGSDLGVVDSSESGSFLFDGKRVGSFSEFDAQAPAPVPLPAGLPLMLACIGGLAVLKRKQRAP